MTGDTEEAIGQAQEALSLAQEQGLESLAQTIAAKLKRAQAATVPSQPATQNAPPPSRP
jgi:hypothetical protein